MIHNHEVESSSLSLATKNIDNKLIVSKLLMFFFYIVAECPHPEEEQVCFARILISRFHPSSICFFWAVGNSCGVINNTSSRRIASTSGGDTHLGLCNSVAIFLCLYFRTDTSSCNSTPRVTHNYQSRSARPYKQRKTPTSEHSCVITLRTLILAPPRGDDIVFSPP